MATKTLIDSLQNTLPKGRNNSVLWASLLAMQISWRYNKNSQCYIDHYTVRKKINGFKPFKKTDNIIEMIESLGKIDCSSGSPLPFGKIKNMRKSSSIFRRICQSIDEGVPLFFEVRKFGIQKDKVIRGKRSSEMFVCYGYHNSFLMVFSENGERYIIHLETLLKTSRNYKKYII